MGFRGMGAEWKAKNTICVEEKPRYYRHTLLTNYK
jgi:hypothetical protein